MAITYADIQKANETLKTTDVKGNPYIEVNQRIKAFRMVYPTGFITDEMLSNENGVCVFKATVGYYAENGDAKILGTGFAYEKESSSYINKTSYIENCDTSAIGRALGMAGFGIDTSVASYEEVTNAINNQGEPEAPKKEAPKTARKATAKQLEILAQVYTGDNLKKLLEANNISQLGDMPADKASELIEKIEQKKRSKANG